MLSWFIFILLLVCLNFYEVILFIIVFELVFFVLRVSEFIMFSKNMYSGVVKVRCLIIGYRFLSYY